MLAPLLLSIMSLTTLHSVNCNEQEANLQVISSTVKINPILTYTYTMGEEYKASSHEDTSYISQIYYTCYKSMEDLQLDLPTDKCDDLLIIDHGTVIIPECKIVTSVVEQTIQIDIKKAEWEIK